MRYKLLVFAAVILLTFSTVSCSPLQGEDEKAIQKIVQAQQQAVLAKDLQAFQSTLGSDSGQYFVEQTHWFEDITANPPSSYHLTIKRIKKISDSLYRVEVEQSFSFSNKHETSILPLYYLQSKQGWRQQGLAYPQIHKENIIIQYHPDLASKARELIGVEAEILSALEDRFSYSPASPIVIRLYEDPEIFRHSVKLSLPEWVGGWNEYRESIKMLASAYPPSLFAQTLTHETIHQMTSELSSDNACYWLQEGMATFFEDDIAHPQGLTEDEYALLSALKKQGYEFSLEQLSSINLEELTDPSMVSGYYILSKSIVQHLYSRYGKQMLLMVFEELKQYPFDSRTGSEKLDILSTRTQTALERVLFIPFQKLSENWRDELELRISTQAKEDAPASTASLTAHLPHLSPHLART